MLLTNEKLIDRGSYAYDNSLGLQAQREFYWNMKREKVRQYTEDSEIIKHHSGGIRAHSCKLIIVFELCMTLNLVIVGETFTFRRRTCALSRKYSEFEFTNTIYNFYIHPQWDHFGSPTLYLKILFADYKHHFVIIELIGEWNDAINNDIMFLKREVIDPFISNGIYKFILIGENVLNFHASDDCYYEEWYEDVRDGRMDRIHQLPRSCNKRDEAGSPAKLCSLRRTDWRQLAL